MASDARTQTDAVVIRRAPFSESSQIVHLLTPMHGRIACLARGSFRPKSEFGGAIDLLTRGQADFTRRRGSELDLLHRFRVTHPYRGARASLAQWIAGAQVLEVVARFSWPHAQELGPFDLLIATLDAIDVETEPAVLETWVVSFIARILTVLGYAPRVDACVACESRIADGAGALLSAGRGGLICGSCADRSPGVVSWSADAVWFARRLFDRAPGPTPTLRVIAEVRHALETYVEHRAERRLATGRLWSLIE